MVGSSFSTFSGIVTIGEIIESHMKKGKLPSTANASSGSKKPFSNFPKKKEGETNAIMGTMRNRKMLHNNDNTSPECVIGNLIHFQFLTSIFFHIFLKNGY